MRPELGPFGSDSGIELHYPARLVWPSPWVGHIPFAFWLIDAIRPRVVVELGVHSGNSYCAFLQAVQSLALTTQCYGIDHWRGDEHADRYGEEVYAELFAYHAPRYGTFSTLMRATFEDALPYFSDRTVDLLHIDGFHSYDAVSKDFADWLPKMSATGVVLCHDTNVRERAFGVWRFWEEIASRYPTFAFVHSHGLGLAYVGSEAAPLALRPLLQASEPETIGRARAYFARLGASLIDRFERQQVEATAEGLRTSIEGIEAARADDRRRAEAAAALRLELEGATAQVRVLQDELAATRGEIALHIEDTTRLRQALATSEAEATRQAEAAGRLHQSVSALRAEAARQAESAARFEQALTAARADVARHTESVASVQRALDGSRVEAAIATARVAAFEGELEAARIEITQHRDAKDVVDRRCAEMVQELERQTDLANVRLNDARKAGDHISRLDDELSSARAEVARHQLVAETLRATAEETAAKVAALDDDLARARRQLTEAIVQRERATGLLRRQIAAAAALQRELTAVHDERARSAAAATTVEPSPPGLLKRIFGVRTPSTQP
jgi:chromosome segregation ATPase